MTSTSQNSLSPYFYTAGSPQNLTEFGRAMNALQLSFTLNPDNLLRSLHGLDENQWVDAASRLHESPRSITQKVEVERLFGGLVLLPPALLAPKVVKAINSDRYDPLAGRLLTRITQNIKRLYATNYLQPPPRDQYFEDPVKSISGRRIAVGVIQPRRKADSNPEQSKLVVMSEAAQDISHHNAGSRLMIKENISFPELPTSDPHVLHPMLGYVAIQAVLALESMHRRRRVVDALEQSILTYVTQYTTANSTLGKISPSYKKTLYLPEFRDAVCR